MNKGASHANARGIANGSLTTDPYRLAVYALLLVTVGRIHQHFSFISALRPGELVVGIAVLYALVRRDAVNLSVLHQWPVTLVGALFIWACVTAPFGLSLGGSGAFVLFTYSKVLVTALLLVIAVRGTADLRGLVWAYLLSCGVLVIFAWTVFDISQAAGSQAMRLGNLYMYDANDIGLLFSIGIPFGLWLARATRGKGRVLSLLIVLGMVATIARSGSRGGFLGLIAVAAALFFLVREVSWGTKILIAGASVLVLSFAAPPGYWQQMETMTEPTDDYNWESYYGRRQTWERGIGYMLENPITGVGIDNFNRAEGMYSERAQRIQRQGGTGRLRWHSAHNTFVQVGSELGIPGLALYSLLVLGSFWKLRKWNRRLPASWRRRYGDRQLLYLATVYLPVAIVGYLVTSSFLTFAYLQPVYILAALTAATIYLLRREVTSQRAGTVDARRGSARPSSGKHIRSRSA